MGLDTANAETKMIPLENVSELALISVKLPIPLVAVIDAIGAKTNTNRSIMLRAALYLFFSHLDITDKGDVITDPFMNDIINLSLSPLNYTPPNYPKFLIALFGQKASNHE